MSLDVGPYILEHSLHLTLSMQKCCQWNSSSSSVVISVTGNHTEFQDVEPHP